MAAESVFICYRRDDTGETAGRIFDRLAAELPEGTVFRDLDSIPLGVDFRVHVEQKLANARVVIVLIGPDWLKIRDEQRKRRLDNAADHVRVEIELALATPGLRVIPILCRRAAMPRVNDLPEPIRDLAFKNGQDVLPDPHFRSSMDHLLKQLRLILAEPAIKAEQPSPAAAPSPAITEEQGNAAAPHVSKTPQHTPLPKAKPVSATDGATKTQAAGAFAPAEKNPAKPPAATAKDAIGAVLALVFGAMMLWGAFLGIRFAFGKAGEGIAWARAKFATPTPAPKALYDPRSLQWTSPKPLIPAFEKTASQLVEESLKKTPQPTPSIPLSERIKLLTNPTPTPAPKLSDSEISTLFLRKPSPTPVFPKIQVPTNPTEAPPPK